MSLNPMLALVSVFVSAALAQPNTSATEPWAVLSVCDALGRLSELNGQQVRIRGAYWVTHVGDVLCALPMCKEPIVRDGWSWRQAISVGRRYDNPKLGELQRKVLIMKAEYAGRAEVLVTLSGRIETREHFKVGKFSERPIGYGDFVAGLRWDQAEDIEVVPAPPEFVSWLQAVAVRPWPVRAK